MRQLIGKEPGQWRIFTAELGEIGGLKRGMRQQQIAKPAKDRPVFTPVAVADRRYISVRDLLSGVGEQPGVEVTLRRAAILGRLDLGRAR